MAKARAKIFLHGVRATPIECDLHVHLQPSGNLMLEFRNRRTGNREAIKYVKVETEKA